MAGESKPLVAAAKPALEGLKYEVAEATGLPHKAGYPGVRLDRATYPPVLDAYKYEVAAELDLKRKIEALGWPELSSRECGAVGGRMGGPIGGQMVKRMIRMAEQRLAQGPALPRR